MSELGRQSRFAGLLRPFAQFRQNSSPILAKIRVGSCRRLGVGGDLLPAGLVHLVIYGPRALGQPSAVAAATDHIADTTVGPEQRAVVAFGGVSHLGGLILRPRGVDGETLARGALIHEERRRTVRAGQ